MAAHQPDDLDQLFEAARAHAARRYPGRSLRRIDLVYFDSPDPEQLPFHPGAAPPAPRAGRPEAAATHSPDFRTVNWFGAAYAFTPAQAAVVRVLWEAWEDGAPAVGQDTLLEAAAGESERVRDLFRGSPAWGALVVSAGRGLFRLAEPPG